MTNLTLHLTTTKNPKILVSLTTSTIPDSIYSRADFISVIVICSIIVVCIGICLYVAFCRKPKEPLALEEITVMPDAADSDEILLRRDVGSRRPWHHNPRFGFGSGNNQSNNGNKPIINPDRPDSPPPTYSHIERQTSFSSYVSHTSSQFEIPPEYHEAIKSGSDQLPHGHHTHNFHYIPPCINPLSEHPLFRNSVSRRSHKKWIEQQRERRAISQIEQNNNNNNKDDDDDDKLNDKELSLKNCGDDNNRVGVGTNVVVLKNLKKFTSRSKSDADVMKKKKSTNNRIPASTSAPISTPIELSKKKPQQSIGKKTIYKTDTTNNQYKADNNMLQMTALLTAEAHEPSLKEEEEGGEGEMDNGVVSICNPLGEGMNNGGISRCNPLGEEMDNGSISKCNLLIGNEEIVESDKKNCPLPPLLLTVGTTNRITEIKNTDKINDELIEEENLPSKINDKRSIAMTSLKSSNKVNKKSSGKTKTKSKRTSDIDGDDDDDDELKIKTGSSLTAEIKNSNNFQNANALLNSGNLKNDKKNKNKNSNFDNSNSDNFDVLNSKKNSKILKTDIKNSDLSMPDREIINSRYLKDGRALQLGQPIIVSQETFSKRDDFAINNSIGSHRIENEDSHDFIGQLDNQSEFYPTRSAYQIDSSNISYVETDPIDKSTTDSINNLLSPVSGKVVRGKGGKSKKSTLI